MKEIDIYTDGACSGNPGIGGYGAVLIYKGIERKISGVDSSTTNNRMELTAVIEALKMLKEEGLKLNIYSDSAYVVNAFNNKWIDAWQQNNFKTANKKEVLNKDLWLALLNLLQKHSYTFIKVKGHSDNKYNNICDELATTEIKNYKKEKNIE